MSYSFSGSIDSSKSLMNRALIVKSFFPELKIKGHSQSDDVQLLEKALTQLDYRPHRPFDVGHGGTTFRFLVSRLSRRAGKYYLKMPARLMERPHQSLLTTLGNLGVSSRWVSRGLEISSVGWKIPDEGVEVGVDKSSQFLSSLLLSCWQLEKDLKIKFRAPVASKAYLYMTLALLRNLGMEILESPGQLVVRAGQRLGRAEYICEPDMSSCFTMAAFAVLFGDSEITGFPKISTQPDHRFIDLFKKMGSDILQKEGSLFIPKSNGLLPLIESLEDTPDLFPVLAILATKAQGKSSFSGLKNLVFKESDRIQKTGELLDLMGVRNELVGDMFNVYGEKDRVPLESHFSFNPDKDHRLVMAATLAKKMGYKIEISEPQHISKSFPQFFDYVSVVP